MARERWGEGRGREEGQRAVSAERMLRRFPGCTTVVVDHYDHPRWDNRRQADAAWALLAGGRIACERIVQPVVSFGDAAEAYRAFVDEHPERSVKLGVTFA